MYKPFVICKGCSLYKNGVLKTMWKSMCKMWNTRFKNVDNCVECVENVK